MDWSTNVVLVTGGTGSFGRKFVDTMLRHYNPLKLIVFSRDELKQHEMRVSGFDHPSLRYFIGDVRDRERLRRAMQGVDVVVHTAALKQVPACEYNPIEAVVTNIEWRAKRHRSSTRHRREASNGVEHGQSGQPGESLRRHQTRRRKALRTSECVQGHRHRHDSVAFDTATSLAAGVA